MTCLNTHSASDSLSVMVSRVYSIVAYVCVFYSSVLLCELIPRESRRGRSTLKGGHVMQESISPGKARSSGRGRSEPRELSVVDNRLGHRVVSLSTHGVDQGSYES